MKMKKVKDFIDKILDFLLMALAVRGCKLSVGDKKNNRKRIRR